MHPSKKGPLSRVLRTLPFLPAGTWPGWLHTAARLVCSASGAAGDGAGKAVREGCAGWGEGGPATLPQAGLSEVCDKFRTVKEFNSLRHPPPDTHTFKKYRTGYGVVL